MNQTYSPANPYEPAYLRECEFYNDHLKFAVENFISLHSYGDYIVMDALITALISRWDYLNNSADALKVKKHIINTCENFKEHLNSTKWEIVYNAIGNGKAVPVFWEKFTVRDIKIVKLLYVECFNFKDASKLAKCTIADVRGVYFKLISYCAAILYGSIFLIGGILLLNSVELN